MNRLARIKLNFLIMFQKFLKMATITLEDCKQWKNCPNINPKSKRKISTCGSIYKSFRKQSIAYGLEESEKMPICQIKWIMLSSEESSVYGKSLIKRCGFCKKSVSYSILHFIHAQDDSSVADYECTRCNKAGNLAYFCFRCRNIDDN